MPIIQTKKGWQVVSVDGKKKMSRDHLTYEEAQKKEKDLAERHPLDLWSRKRGILDKP